MAERRDVGAGPDLWVVATPIGNLDDLSPRAAAALRAVDVVACEDTRRTATLLRHIAATTPMLATHRHNEMGRVAELVGRMRAGERVALVSDAGTPGIRDPGAAVVRAAHAAGLWVTVVPGAGAVEAAVAASGLGEEGFQFVGFFPRRAVERAALWESAEGSPLALVGFESPNRLPALLADLAARDADRGAVVCRELTKLHEEVVAGTAAELATRFTAAPRGEVTVVIAPLPARPPSDAALRAGLALLLADGLSPRRCAEVVAALGASARNEAYAAALELAASAPPIK